MALFTPQQRQTALWTGIGILLIAILLLLGPILTPFIAGSILAYALNPIVEWLRSKRLGNLRMPRIIAVIIVMMLLFSVVTAFALIMIPMLIREWPMLHEQIPAFIAKVNNYLNPILNELGIQVPADNASIKRILTEQFVPKGDGVWKSLIASAKFGGTAVLTWAWNLILIPVVLFYLLKDWHIMMRKLRDMIPRRWVSKAVSFSREVSNMLAQYLRGQLLVMMILSTYYSIALALAGYNVALPVGIMTGMLAFIPYIGICFGLGLAATATLLQFTGMEAWITLGIIYGFGYSFDGLLMTPKLVGDRIQLHPLIVIFALLAFGQLFGFVGILLALPSSAILSVAYRHLRSYYFDSNFYRN